MFNNKIASKNSSTALKKYCKVCHDAGKSETEYTSHFIRENRDPCSKVVCPTLLSLECRYCSKKGHTVKYCKNLEKDKIAETRQSKSSNAKKPKSEEKYKQPNNMFSNLESDSEDEKEEQEVVIRVPAATITTNIKSYASALLRPAITSKEVKIAPIITRQNNDVVPSYNNIKSTYIKNKSWADTDSDSDSDSEEEKEVKEEVNDPNW